MSNEEPLHTNRDHFNHGSQPKKNEQSGSKPTQLERMNKSIQQFKDYFDEQYPCDTDDSCGDNMNDLDRTRWSQYESLIALSRILTAAKVSTVDEVISKIERYQPLELQVVELLGVAKCKNVLEVVQMLDRQPLSDEDIERAASKYAFENNTHRSNSKAFIAGANFAKQPPKTRKII